MKFKSKISPLRNELINQCIIYKTNKLWFGTSQHQGKTFAWVAANKDDDRDIKWANRITTGRNVLKKTPVPFKVNAMSIIQLLGRLHYINFIIAISITRKKIKVYLDDEKYIQEKYDE